MITNLCHHCLAEGTLKKNKRQVTLPKIVTEALVLTAWFAAEVNKSCMESHSQEFCIVVAYHGDQKIDLKIFTHILRLHNNQKQTRWCDTETLALCGEVVRV